MPTTVTAGYPHHHEGRLLLRNGRAVFLRPIRPTDGLLLVDLFNRISPESRYLRFLGHITDLTEQMLYHFTHVDYVTEFALAAVVEEEGEETIIAVARYAVDAEEGIADLAVAVRDDWQRLGLGTSLLSRIIVIGKEHGICRFGSMMAPENDVVKRILRDLGYTVSYRFQDGSYRVEITA